MTDAARLRHVARPVVVEYRGVRAVSRFNRKRWLSALGFLAFVLALAVAQVYQARTGLESASARMAAAIALARNGNELTRPAIRATIEADVAAANMDFVVARSDLWLWAPVLPHLSWIPVVGGRLAAAGPIADAGSAATAGALDILEGVNGVWPLIGHRSGSTSTLARIAPTLLAGVDRFRHATSQLDAALNAVHRIPTNVGSAYLNTKVQQLRSDLPALRNVALWLEAAPTLLGDESPSHLLLVWENPQQIRATGGFIPAANYITL
ncbi:MAG TPA: hypothetical protein VG815_21850, partial [Chloroflexota bacterium]|nr:hypothetical protein [Chloroflexota bacterium]